MARRSRKAEMSIKNISEKTLKIGLYVRLSKADNGLRGRNSIENQLEMLTVFSQGIGEKKEIYSYIDNGETGTDFSRPNWKKLMEDVRTAKVNCIIVKDLSRFARNYLEAGEYMEKTFPLLGVRFIAINDCYDSSNLLFSENNLSISIKNLVNDYYSKDVSKKIVSSFQIKKQKGECIGSKAPYGYVIQDNHYVIDEEAAGVVREIFNMKLQGKSAYGIAKTLNYKNIPPPSRYACEKGFKKYKANYNTLWQQQAVIRILYNQVYIGNLVQGKYNCSIYTKEKNRKRKELDWEIIPNAHEGIIDESTFHKVQKESVEGGD